MIAELIRITNERKMQDQAVAIVQSVRTSKSVLEEAAVLLADRATMLNRGTPDGASHAEQECRKRLCASASAALAGGSPSVMEWAVSQDTVRDLNLVEECHMRRLTDKSALAESVHALMDVVKRLLTEKTRAEIVAAMQAVRDATGPDELAHETAKDALDLVVRLPA